MIQHLYTLWSDHHNKSNNHLSSYIVTTVSLTPFPMLYISPCDLFYNWKLAFLNPPPLFCPFYHPHTLKTNKHFLGLTYYFLSAADFFKNLSTFPITTSSLPFSSTIHWIRLSSHRLNETALPKSTRNLLLNLSWLSWLLYTPETPACSSQTAPFPWVPGITLSRFPLPQ